MRENIDTDLLRSFVAISESGSFTRAADQVGRTQSAVSMQIKRLEDVVGHSLFLREGRQIELTNEGEALLSYARRILKLNDEALSALSAPQVEGVVRLGAPDEYATAFLPGILSSFSRAYPKVQIELECKTTLELRPALAANELDLAIITGYPDHPGHDVLLREPVVWATSVREFAHEQDPLPLALFQPGCIFRRWVLDALDRAGRAYQIRYSCPSLAGLTAAVTAGLAVTVLSQSTMPAELRQIGEDEGLPELYTNEIQLALSPGRDTPAVARMREHIINWFASVGQVAA